MRGGIAFCCTCGNCVLDSDDFNRADSASIGADWSVVSGSPAISGNRLLFSTAGEITFLQDHTSLTARARVVTQIIPVTSGLIVELQIAKSSSTTFLGVRFDFGACQTMQLFKCVAGVKTLLGNLVTISDPLNVAQLNTIEICWDPNIFRLRAKATPVTGNALMVEVTDTSLLPGLKSGIKCSSLAYFDNYSFEWMGASSDALHGFCPKCSAGCLIDSDTFDTDNDCKWSFSGTRGTVASGTLISSSEMRLFRNAANADTDPTIITATIALQNVPGQFELVIGENGITYYFGRLIANDPTQWALSLGNIATDVTFTADQTKDYVLELCLTPAETVTSVTESQEFFPLNVALSTGWLNPNNALTFGGGDALYGMGGAPPVTSDEFRLNFDVDPLLPSGKTLVNIKVEFWAGHDGSSTDVVSEVSVNGVFAGGLYTLNTGSARYEVFGLWGLTTTDQINSGLSAGLRFVDSDTGTAQITVDYTKVTVYYLEEDPIGGFLKLSIREFGYSSQIACVLATNILPLGAKAGFITDSAQWFLRDVTYQHGRSDDLPQCPACRCDSPPQPCGMCQDYLAPRYFALTISGLSSFAAPFDCSLCATLDGTYILEKWDNYPYWSSGIGPFDRSGASATNPFHDNWNCGFDGGEVCAWGTPEHNNLASPDLITGFTNSANQCGGMALSVESWGSLDESGNLYLCMLITIIWGAQGSIVPGVAFYGQRIGPITALDASQSFDCINFNNEVFPLLQFFPGDSAGCNVPPSVTLSSL